MGLLDLKIMDLAGTLGVGAPAVLWLVWLTRKALSNDDGHSKLHKRIDIVRDRHQDLTLQLAKEYVTRGEHNHEFEKLEERIERIDEKLDKLLNRRE